MKKKKIGQIAREELPKIIRRNPLLATDLLDTCYCEKTFKIHTPLISTTQVNLPCGDLRYYAKPMVNADGNDYYLFMHWRESHRKDLLAWLWSNR